MISIKENGNVRYENQTDVDRELLANEKSPKYYYDETVRLAGAAEDAQEAAEEAAEAAMTSTPEGYADFVDNLAPAYSSSATYSAGDYVLHESILYKANADISSAENWTAAHWTEVRTMTEVSDLKEDLSQASGYEAIALTSGYIRTDGTTVNISTIVSNASYRHCVVNCSEGDEFVLNGNCTATARLWNFIDSNGNILTRSGGPVSTGDKFIKVTAPENAAKAIFNFQTSAAHYCVFQKVVSASDVFTEATEAVGTDGLGFTSIPLVRGYITTDGTTVDVTAPSNSANFRYMYDDTCTAGDTYIISGNGGGAARLWCFADSSGNILQVAGNSVTSNGGYISLIAPINAAVFICNVYASSDNPKVFKISSDCAADLITTHFSPSDFQIGRYAISNNGAYTYSNIFSCSKDFIPSYIKGFTVQGDVKVAVCYWNKSGKYSGNDYWIDLNKSYYFDHDNYNYKIYGGKSDESILLDVTDFLDYVTVYASKSKYLSLYSDVKQENLTLKNRVDALSAGLQSVMHSDYKIAYANTLNPMSMENYVGNNQNAHPKVLYFSDGFSQHQFWMAYTPYPFSRDAYENPCIAYSDDGYEWTNIAGNPINNPNGDGYNSDTHLVYNSDTAELECWFRYVSDDDTSEIIKRCTSADGVTWTTAETLQTNSNSGSISKLLSPSVVYDGTNYCIWVVNNSTHAIDYYTAPKADATTWTLVRSISLTYTDDNDVSYNPWHLDAIVDNGTYIAVVMCKSTTGNVWTLFLTTSDDNTAYTTPNVIMYGNSGGWDKYIYRTSIVNVGGEYRLYYSATTGYSGGSRTFGMGVSVSNSLTEFIGSF